MRQKADPARFCKACGTQLARKRFNGRLEDRIRFLSRKHCGERCMAQAMMIDQPTLAGLRCQASPRRMATISRLAPNAAVRPSLEGLVKEMADDGR